MLHNCKVYKLHHGWILSMDILSRQSPVPKDAKITNKNQQCLCSGKPKGLDKGSLKTLDKGENHKHVKLWPSFYVARSCLCFWIFWPRNVWICKWRITRECYMKRHKGVLRKRTQQSLRKPKSILPLSPAPSMNVIFESIQPHVQKAKNYQFL